MREVYKSLFVGGDKDYQKIKNDPDWRTLRACKEGEDGHRSILQYTERAAPPGPNYLHVKKGRVLALNLVDADSDDYIPSSALDTGVAFISENLRLGHKVLVACNGGQSRGPSLAMLWLALEGKLPGNYNAAARQFQRLYPDYDPGDGMRLAVKKRIQVLRNKR